MSLFCGLGYSGSGHWKFLMLELRPEGLYCPAGDFFIDPWRPVKRAVVTHAHADHARPGSKAYLCSESGLEVTKIRLPKAERIETLAWGEQKQVGGARLSLHPAGHILGSAQVRVKGSDGVWVVSGDYKTVPDKTCEAFEPVACDVFITECTFGLPVYSWEPDEQIYSELLRWWKSNAEQGLTSVVCAYSLGKAQRVLANLDASIGPIVCHGSVRPFLGPYARSGVTFPELVSGNREDAKQVKGSGLVIAPQSALRSPWMKKYAPLRSAFVSGWMTVRGARRRGAFDKGFALSDHADWKGLLSAVKDTGASRVLATHGQTASFVRYLREQGLEADGLETAFGEMEEH